MRHAVTTAGALVVTMPAHPAGRVRVTVYSPFGTPIQLTYSFTAAPESSPTTPGPNPPGLTYAQKYRPGVPKNPFNAVTSARAVLIWAGVRPVMGSAISWANCATCVG